MAAHRSRRRLLAGLGTASTALLAGCSSVFGTPRARIGELVFINRADAPQTVVVRIESDGETVFHRTQDVPSRDETQPVVTDGLPTDPGRYTVTARLDDGTDEIRRTLPQNGRGGCYSVTVRLDADGTFRDVPTTVSPDACE